MESVRLEIELSPDPASIRHACDLVGLVAEGLFADPDLGVRLWVTSHELLDNSREHGLTGFANLTLSVEKATERGSLVRLRVKNPTNAAYVEALMVALAELVREEDPWAHYLNAMRRSADQHMAGLGLARIRAEGEMRVSASFGQDFVCVEAQTYAGGGPCNAEA